MIIIPPIDESDLKLLVSYTISREEKPTSAIIQAFSALNIDVFDHNKRLQDYINTDALNDLDWDSESPIYLSTEVWDHPIVITPNHVKIYAE